MRLLAGFVVALGVVLLVAAVVATVAKSPEPPPDCQPGQACGGPPPGEAVASEPATPRPSVDLGVGIRAGVPWRSTELGVEFEYNDRVWVLEREDGHSAELSLDASIDASLTVEAVPASEADAEALAKRRLADISSSVPDLAPDDRGRYAILGPAIGYIDGVGGTFAGSVTSAQGATTPVGVSLLAASDGRTTVVITLVVAEPDAPVGDEWAQLVVREGAAELIVKTFRWTPSS